MPRIGIIGGSGLYELLDSAMRVSRTTDYGEPSAELFVGTLNGVEVAFLPRHGSKHTIPPHMVPYRANIAAMKSLGVERIIATNAVGSLNPDYKPGELAFFDQFMNMTQGRKDTFYDGNMVAHVGMADPYCGQLRKIAAETASKLGIKNHPSGSVMVINGPRFSTRAESRFFSKAGFDMINMTQYPEVVLAREQGMCYLGVGLITDYDVGLEGNNDVKPVSAEAVGRIFSENVKNVKELISALVSAVPADRTCDCSGSMDGAVQTK